MYSPDRPSKNTQSLKKSNSCSTIFIDDNTASQPNLKMMLKCVSLAIYYHVKNRYSDAFLMDIFDERLHPLTKEPVPENYNRTNPEHKHIYRFIKNLFSAAQLTAECAIITLVSICLLIQYSKIFQRSKNFTPLSFALALRDEKILRDLNFAVPNLLRKTFRGFCKIKRENREILCREILHLYNSRSQVSKETSHLFGFLIFSKKIVFRIHKDIHAVMRT